MISANELASLPRCTVCTVRRTANLKGVCAVCLDEHAASGSLLSRPYSHPQEPGRRRNVGNPRRLKGITRKGRMGGGDEVS